MDTAQGSSLTLTVQLQQDNGEVATSKCLQEHSQLFRKTSNCRLKMPQVAPSIGAPPRCPVFEFLLLGPWQKGWQGASLQLAGGSQPYGRGLRVHVSMRAPCVPPRMPVCV